MNDACSQCEAKCCRYFCFEIDRPETYQEFENVRWFLCHEGVKVHVDDEADWYIALDNPCRYLGSDDRCEVYDNRPLICRQYDAEACDYSEGRYGHQREFADPQELEDYARQALGEAVFQAAREKESAKTQGRETCGGNWVAERCGAGQRSGGRARRGADRSRQASREQT